MTHQERARDLAERRGLWIVHMLMTSQAPNADHVYWLARGAAQMGRRALRQGKGE